MHPRKRIRKAFVDRLRASTDGVFPTAASARVSNSRVPPILTKPANFPAILVYTREEKIDPERGYGADGGESHTTRVLDMIVEAFVMSLDDLDDKLDDIAEQIESRLVDWEIPGHESAKVRLIESDVDVVSQGVQTPVGAIGLTYRITYFAAWNSSPPEPAVAIPTSLTLNARPHPPRISFDDAEADAWMCSE